MNSLLLMFWPQTQAPPTLLSLVESDKGTSTASEPTAPPAWRRLWACLVPSPHLGPVVAPSGRPVRGWAWPASVTSPFQEQLTPAQATVLTVKVLLSTPRALMKPWRQADKQGIAWATLAYWKTLKRRPCPETEPTVQGILQFHQHLHQTGRTVTHPPIHPPATCRSLSPVSSAPLSSSNLQNPSQARHSVTSMRSTSKNFCQHPNLSKRKRTSLLLLLPLSWIKKVDSHLQRGLFFSIVI